MSFEDLQKKWEDQFRERKRAANSNAEAALLQQIRRDERRFRTAVILLALSDVAAFSYLAWIIAVALKHGELFPQEIRNHRPIAMAGMAIWTALIVVANRLRASIAPAAAGGSAAFPGRVYRDGSRFDAMVLWHDLREFAAGGGVIFLAAFQAWHATRYAALDWIAVVLFVVAIAAFAAFRFRTQAQRPPSNDTLVGRLTMSIYQTRRRAQLMNNLWWFVGPVILGGILLGPMQGILAQGGVNRPAVAGAAVMIAAGSSVWLLNRRAARGRLRLRLEQLEQLQAELSPESSLPPS